MGTGQMMLTIGAMLLLSAIILSTNSSVLTTQDSLISTKIQIMALSKARAIVEEANSKNFDERNITQGFTSIGSLGRDSGEEYPQPGYDDFDDFASYGSDVPSDSIQGIPFNVDVNISYVNFSSGGNISNSTSPTNHKRMIVRVTSPFLTNPMKISASNPSGQDTVSLVSYYSYW